MASIARNVRFRYPADSRRRQVVETVLDLVAKRGADAVSAQAIADAIGVSQPAIFRHFPNKEAMWVSVLDWLDESLAEIYGGALAEGEGSPLDILERMFLGHIRLGECRPALAKLVFSDHLRLQYPRLHTRFREIHQPYEARVIALLKRAVRAGEVSTALASGQAATLYFCMVQGLGFQMAIAQLLSEPMREAKRVFALYRLALTCRTHGAND